jgi:[acyl-carrier-protein] S-malonyltransferase
VDAIRDELGNQLTRSVRWAESVTAMVAAGAKRFFEFGPKDVLSGLLRRIDREASSTALNSAEAVHKLVEEATS